MIAADDFTYGDPGKFYCTESVVSMYRNAGVVLMTPKTPKEVFKSKASYTAFIAINWLVRKLTGMGFDPNGKFYFVGNEQQGLMASQEIYRIYKYPHE